jgi:predicted AAA+ superfamily ATPase
MKYIKRDLEELVEKRLFKGKLIIIYGARRIGKTTLVKHILEKHQGRYINCDTLDAQESLQSQNSKTLKSFLGPGNLFVLDEAQRVKNIGINLKILVDTYPEIQIIATGSSSFDLSNKIKEPLTGRTYSFIMNPISYNELVNFDHERFFGYRNIDELISFGGYPEVIFAENNDEKKIILNEICSNYLYKDIFNFEDLRRPDMLKKILQLLSLQVGSEVSLNEISSRLECSRSLVEKYLFLLEQAFVIFHLRPLSRNKRNEIGKKDKIYFYDLGIRNMFANSFKKIDQREDLGGVWENFLISERNKYIIRNQLVNDQYFWRNWSGAEVDYIEEFNDAIYAYEFKWSQDKAKLPKDFHVYTSELKIINKDNFNTFII